MHLERAGAEVGLMDNSPGTDFVTRTLSPLVASTSLPTLTGKKNCPVQGQFSFKLQEKDMGPIGQCAHSQVNNYGSRTRGIGMA